MDREVAEKYVSAVDYVLFPNNTYTKKQVVDSLINVKESDIKELIKFPFADLKIAKISAFFGMEMFYVWNKETKVAYLKRLLSLIPALIGCVILSVNEIIGGIIAAVGFIIFFIYLARSQKKMKKNIIDYCRAYNCSLLIKFSEDKKFISKRKIFHLIEIVLKDKEFRKAVKDGYESISDSFYVN